MSDDPDDAPVTAYHAHVYYDPPTTRQEAARLRAWLEGRYAVRLGRWHDVPVGPHTAAMYQVAFAPALFASVVPFLMLNRGTLSILVHPETGRPRADHLAHALWLGTPLALRGEVLPETES